MKCQCVCTLKRLMLLYFLDRERFCFFTIHSSLVLTRLLSAAIAKLLLKAYHYSMGKEKKNMLMCSPWMQLSNRRTCTILLDFFADTHTQLPKKFKKTDGKADVTSENLGIKPRFPTLATQTTMLKDMLPPAGEKKHAEYKLSSCHCCQLGRNGQAVTRWAQVLGIRLSWALVLLLSPTPLPLHLLWHLLRGLILLSKQPRTLQSILAAQFAFLLLIATVHLEMG